MSEQSDGFDGMEGSLWRNVMSVECGNECLRVEHNLFFTNQPSVIKVYVPDQGFPDRGYPGYRAKTKSFFRGHVITTMSDDFSSDFWPMFVMK